MSELPNQSSLEISSPVQSRQGKIVRIISSLALVLAIGIIGWADMPAMYLNGDPSIWREETRSILNSGTLSVDPAVFPNPGEPGQALVQNPKAGLFYVKYGLMNSLMSLPPMWLERQVLEISRAPMTEPNLPIFNGWQVLQSMLLAWVLLRIAGLYTTRFLTSALFVLSCFYCTFVWYYLRAQASELGQLLFFAVLYLNLVQLLNSISKSGGAWRAYILWLFAAMLVLSRILYLLLIPLILIFVFIAIWRTESAERIRLLQRRAVHSIVPPILIITLLGYVNYIKFGSPFLTGYHAWHPEMHRLTGSFLEGIHGFLFHWRFSIFVHFPILIFALFFMHRFVKAFPLDAMVTLGTAMVFILFVAKIPTWAGEWTYGPRYLIFILPPLSIPFIFLLDWLIDHPRKIATWLFVAAILPVLLYSSYLQFQMNRVGFFTYYGVRQGMEPDWPPEVADYFLNTNAARITDSIWRHRDNLDELWWFEDLKKTLSPDRVERERQIIQFLYTWTNHYYFPPDMTQQR